MKFLFRFFSGDVKELDPCQCKVDPVNFGVNKSLFFIIENIQIFSSCYGSVEMLRFS